MPYIKDYGKAEDINFLASAKYVSYTYQISDAGVTANAQGRKIVKAGTPYPANDDTAIGIVFIDTDVTEGPQPGAILVDAWILEARLPVALAAAAKTSLAAKSNIKFKLSV
ncbi:hypothetical protein [Paenibacillus sp. IHBB 3054]|uniref:hypothetical protein n=1 Tax=Paenibacillus sp. IHBB 3054 TaxID=3425689 RepID=UPI003F662CE2